MSIESVIPSKHPIHCCHLVLPPSIFPSVRVFSNQSVLHNKWPKYWSFRFNISPSSEYSGLISCRMYWLESPRDSQESSPTLQFKSINSSALSFLYSPTLTSIHDCWKQISRFSCWELSSDPLGETTPPGWRSHSDPIPWPPGPLWTHPRPAAECELTAWTSPFESHYSLFCGLSPQCVSVWIRHVHFKLLELEGTHPACVASWPALQPALGFTPVLARSAVVRHHDWGA